MDKNKDQTKPENYRKLTEEEIKILNISNTSDNWNNIEVGEFFDPQLIKNCNFRGYIKIGSLSRGTLEDNGVNLPVGIYNCTVADCMIGSNNAIHNVTYFSNYKTGDYVFICNIGEIHTSSNPNFGNGCIKSKTDEARRNWISVWNENEKRKILLFDEMLTADAYIWARYRHRKKLLCNLIEFTDLILCNDFGIIGDNAVVKHCKTIKNVNIGEYAYITGADILLNITVNSSVKERTLIGEGVQLKDGIVNFGCKIYFGVKAVRFFISKNCTVNNGARLIDTFLGDNSTVSCCEISNNLIFPGHEQHHNNSFLIASLIQGQSNIASGATIGSNHNSRTADGEITAKRGFWPGLCTSFKHNSRFASFVLIVKGSYKYELDIPFPFSLVINSENSLKIIPAFSFLFNMYSLARNDRKFKERDKRIVKNQNIVFEHLAPDTIDEIFHAIYLLEIFTGKSFFSKNNKYETDVNILTDKGKQLLKKESLEDLVVTGENIEKSGRKVKILKPESAYSIYKEIINYYCIKTIISNMEKNNINSIKDFPEIKIQHNINWINAGGQLIRNTDLENIINNIEEGKIKSWDALHSEYSDLWEKYEKHRFEHAINSLKKLHALKDLIPTETRWNNFCKMAAETQDRLFLLASDSRKKDFTNNFRKIAFENLPEMEAVYGLYKDDKVIIDYKKEADNFKELLKKYLF